MTTKKIIVKALISYLIKKEDENIGQIFSQLCAFRFEVILFEKKKKVITQGYHKSKEQGRVRRCKEVACRIYISNINVSNCAFQGRFEGERMSTKFAYLFWIRTSIEAQVKLRDLKEYTLIFIDHELKINIMSKKIYKIGK